jgi:hypothetical protein
MQVGLARVAKQAKQKNVKLQLATRIRISSGYGTTLLTETYAFRCHIKRPANLDGARS